MQQLEAIFSNKDLSKEILKRLSIPRVFTLNRTNKFFKSQTENYLKAYLEELGLNIATEIPPKTYFKFLATMLQNDGVKSFSIEDFYKSQMQLLKDSILKKLINYDEDKMKLFLCSPFLTIYLFNFATPYQLVDFSYKSLLAMAGGVFNYETLLTMPSNVEAFELLIYFFETFSLLKLKELSPKAIECFLHLAKDKEFRFLFKKLSNSDRDKILFGMEVFWKRGFFTDHNEKDADKNCNVIQKLVKIILTADFSVIPRYGDLLSSLAILSDEIFNTLTPKCYENLRLKEKDHFYVEYCKFMLKDKYIIKYLEDKEITLEELLSLDGEQFEKLRIPLNIKIYIQKNRNQDPSTKDFLSFKC